MGCLKLLGLAGRQMRPSGSLCSVRLTNWIVLVSAEFVRCLVKDERMRVVTLRKVRDSTINMQICFSNLSRLRNQPQIYQEPNCLPGISFSLCLGPGTISRQI